MSSPDCQLLSEFVARRSETAFQALVARHVNLVFATALRQVGERGVAEEVTQNVFVVLARKSPSLAGFDTLAGWLYRTTLLESKARIRAELRRKRREESAVQLLASESLQPEDSLAQLVPLLDEGLLQLNDSDRLALMLRFMEERPVDEVSSVLGVSQDAARKRIERALDRLASFFRRRGFASAGATAAVGLMAQTAESAPAGLAMTAANAGLNAGAAAGGSSVILLKIMALSKLQTAIICGMVAAAPVVWEWRAQGRAEAQLSSASTEINALQKRSGELETELARVNKSYDIAERTAFNSQARLTTLEAQRSGKTPPVLYHWDDQSPYARIPKQVVKQLSLYSVFNPVDEKLEPLIKNLLQVSDAESDQVESTIAHLLSSVYDAQSKTMRAVEPTPDELRGHATNEVRVFKIGTTGDEVKDLKNAFYAQLDSILGTERAAILEKSIANQLPFDTDAGISSTYLYIPQEHRIRFYKPNPGDAHMIIGINIANGSSISGPRQIDEIQANYLSVLQDWIDLAHSKPSNP